MNYGRKKASKRQQEITSKNTMQGKRVGVRLFKAFLLLIIVGCVSVAAGGIIFIKKIIDDSPDISPSDVRPSGYTTFVYADDGTTEIERFVASGSNRVYKSINEIPENLQHAFVAIEDERFYDHKGIDPQGILRAAIVGISHGGHFTEGASTITQQLIKNNVFPNFVSEDTFSEKVERKLQEQFLALDIEKQMTKKEILESYMNTINLGQNTLGVQSAAKRYFNKDVSELTLSECAVIAGITQNPSANNPISNPEENAKRRTKILGDMLKQGYIDQAAYDEAIADDVYSRIQNINNEIGEDSPYTYFVDALSQQVIDDLISRLGYSESQAYNALYSGGLSIYSTQDLALQQICDEEMNNPQNYPWLTEVGISYALTVTRADGTVENFSSSHLRNYALEAKGDKQGLLYSSEDEARAFVEEWKSTIAREGDTYVENLTLTPQPQAAVTLMDQSNGQIKAIVGGRGSKTSSQSLNRAYQGSPRQPGSCFKILSTYAPALDACGKTLATIIRDEPWHYSNGASLKNASGGYLGDITMRKAIEQSQNVCAVKMINEVTPTLGYQYAENFGLTTLEETDKVESIALGGLTHGVYNYQLCAAFACIANGGVYNSPTLYSKILDHDGNVLLEGNKETRTVIKDSTAALLTEAMQDVVTYGTGRNAQLGNMPVSGKTGTTDHDQDLWFCAFTPYYTCAVWGGYDENKSLTSIDTQYRFRIWRGIMSRVHENLEYRDFNMPTSVERKTVCSLTGCLARAGACPAVTEFFAAGSVPNEVCPGHGYYNNGTESDEITNTTPDEGNTVIPNPDTSGDDPNGGEVPPEQQPPEQPTDPPAEPQPDPPAEPQPEAMLPHNPKSLWQMRV
ncbi:MAG: PBP1A family penicillin-binding protein [Dorea sp.]|nr:PBP1A family penicillin-binding protein [Dorea sp.]